MKKWLMAVQKPVSNPIWGRGEEEGHRGGHGALSEAGGRGRGGNRPHLNTDDDDEGGGDGDGEGLIVGQLRPIVTRGVGEDAVGDEEHEHGGVDALGDADEELTLVEEQVELAGLVQLGVLHAPLLRHVLRARGTLAPPSVLRAGAELALTAAAVGQGQHPETPPWAHPT